MGTFHKLTPRTDVELGVYRNALSFVFANDDIRNIAITGTYGAGKTTIIQSYQNATKQEYVYVSLAPFEKNSELTKHEDSKNNKTNENSNHDIQKLEKKVINQLIHSICPKKVPRTSFRIKKDVSRRHRIRVTLLVAVISLLTFYLVKFDNLSRYLATINPEDTCFFCVLSHFTKPRARIHSTITLAVLLIWVLYFGVSFLTSNKVLAKLSMWGNDLEIFTDDHDSEFDKYLDEILYLIENSGSNVFVFYRL